MTTKNFIIKNKSGLHVRPAGVLVKIIQPFACDVTLQHHEKSFNAKSVLGIMSACIKCNDEITISCDGADEAACIAAIEEGIESGLGE